MTLVFGEFYQLADRGWSNLPESLVHKQQQGTLPAMISVWRIRQVVFALVYAITEDDEVVNLSDYRDPTAPAYPTRKAVVDFILDFGCEEAEANRNRKPAPKLEEAQRVRDATPISPYWAQPERPY
ncbi:hypothetical protein Rt10032_c09g3956 [Rhodotorula toruloides]|uniref:Uncharacterized protein n=1 Tax=Rhodotorula toruloides TaxID=5286 RepID=A0A511KHT2_RHOTO|nr:hypothetical protein Rt10032_c09g3956 [Rhodotorula toruloides]